MGRRTRSAIVVVALLPLLTGCVERRFRVESNPPGAYVYINNTPYGPTPVDVPFLFYGDYDVRLVKEGFETKKVRQPVPPPWYEYPVIDFFSEALWPAQLTDIRPLFYELQPVCEPNLERLKAEGEELRRRGAALPPPRYPERKREQPAAHQEVRPEAVLPPPREMPATLPPPGNPR